MRTSDVIRLRHMLEAAREAVSFAAGKTPDDLQHDRLLTLALLKSVEIVGEAASKVEAATRAGCPEIPWDDIVGMRNRLVHVYFDVDLERICDTIATDLPPLIASIEKILGTVRE
jgi:uncharacterized protein with HEPN domain